MINISYKILPVEWYNGDGGSPSLNSRILDKMQAVITITGQKCSLGYSWKFDSAKTITMDNDISDASVNPNYEDLTKKYFVGETIAVTGTVSNNSTFTITAVTSTQLTVAEAVTTETAYTANIYVSSIPTALDFYYNLIANSAAESYFSLTDKRNFQRYSISGLSASDVSTHKKFTVSTQSNAWVTDALTGQTSECDIVGNGVSGTYVWSFIITHTFFQAPFWLREQVANFKNSLIPPTEFLNGDCLKYICRFDSKYSGTTPVVVDSGSVTNINGGSAWFNSASFDGRPNYSLDYITYTDHVTSGALTALDMNRVVDVEIGIKATSALFSNTNTYLVLNHIYCPMDESSYKDTQTTIRQNLMNDRCKLKLGDSSKNGEYFGTDYSILTNISATYVSTTKCKINFSCDYATALKTILKAKAVNDRQYAFSVTTQDYTLTSTTAIDRTSVLCDFQNADYDTRDRSLISNVDNFRVYTFPNLNTNPANTIEGFEGDPLYVDFPFRLNQKPVNGVVPTLTKAGFSIVAIKSGANDFIIDQRVFDTGTLRKLCGSQDVNLSQSLGMVKDDIYNQFKLFRDKEYDHITGDLTQIGYVLRTGLVLRYESWENIFNGQSEYQSDIAKDVSSVSQQWTSLTYNQCGGTPWSLVLRFYAEVIGYDGYITAFQTDCPIKVKNINDNASDEVLDNSKTTIRYFDTDDNQVNGIIADGVTKVIVDYFGDLTKIPAGYDHIWGYAIAHRRSGDFHTRRFASTEGVSESDSPFSQALTYSAPDSLGSGGNIMISRFGNTQVSLSFYYDSTKQDWWKEDDSIILFTRIGWSKSGSFDDSFDSSFED